MIEMTDAKKAFVMYFDNYPLLISLPPEQRGWLLTALMVYADRVWRDSSVTAEEIAEQFPRLTGEARMAFGFMAAAVLRDTQTWLNRQEYRTRKKQEREAACAEKNKRAMEDMERMRRLMEQEAAKERLGDHGSPSLTTATPL